MLRTTYHLIDGSTVEVNDRYIETKLEEDGQLKYWHTNGKYMAINREAIAYYTVEEVADPPEGDMVIC